LVPWEKVRRDIESEYEEPAVELSHSGRAFSRKILEEARTTQNAERLRRAIDDIAEAPLVLGTAASSGEKKGSVSG
jgi:hypothetical protein